MTAHPIVSARPRAERHRGRYEGVKWRSAYRFAILNAAVFFFFSSANALYVGTPIELHVAAAALFMVGSIVAFYRLCESGGSLAAISYFTLGAGMAFGFGTAYSVYAEGYVFEQFFDKAEQINNLPIMNLMNSMSVLVVIATSWFVAKVDGPATAFYRLKDIFGVLQMLRVPAIILSVIYVALFLWTFPIPENLIVRNVVAQLNAMPILVILISFSTWHSQSGTGKLIAVLTACIMIALGILEAGKAPVLVPILAMTAGLYFGGYRRTAAALVAGTAVFYFTVLAPSVSELRALRQYHLEGNTISDRAALALEVTTGHSDPMFPVEPGDFEVQLIRFLHAPVQSYLIDEWRAGRYGNSLADAWTALIPRVLWHGKPIVTRFAEELYGRMFRRTPEDATSAQSPTYTAEALWNYGWFGVLAVSVLLGLELGWFTRKWLQFINGSKTQIGVVLFSIPIAKYSIVVETWIAASYIGGFVTLAVLVTSVDLVLLPFLRRRRIEMQRSLAARAPR